MAQDTPQDPINRAVVVYADQYRAVADFAEAAAKRFAEDSGLTSFSDPEIMANGLALRWGMHNRAVLVVCLDDDFQPLIFGDIVTRKNDGLDLSFSAPGTLGEDLAGSPCSTFPARGTLVDTGAYRLCKPASVPPRRRLRRRVLAPGESTFRWVPTSEGPPGKRGNFAGFVFCRRLPTETPFLGRYVWKDGSRVWLRAVTDEEAMVNWWAYIPEVRS